MERRTTLDEIIYYEDDNVTVTSREVKLGDDVYPIAEVRYAGVVEKFRGLSLGKMKVSQGLLYMLVWLFIYVPSTFLLVPFFASLEQTRDYQLSYTFFCAAGLLVIVNLILDWWLRKSGYYTPSLTMTLYPGRANSFSSSDKKYLQEVAKNINRAAVSDYKAQKMRRKEPSRFIGHT